MTTTLARLSYQIDRTHVDAPVPWEWGDDARLWVDPAWSDYIDRSLWRAYVIAPDPTGGWRVHLDHGSIRVRLVRVDIEGRILLTVTPDDALRSAGAYDGPVDYFGLEAVG